MQDSNFLSCFSEELSCEILAVAERFSFPKGTEIIRPGEPMRGAYILLEGTVKLFRVFESEEKHLLYMMHGGGLCALSTLTGLIGEDASILAEAEEDVEFLVLPQAVANQWFVEKKEWRLTLLSNFLEGWQESMAMLDAVAFEPLQRRLEKYLAEHAALSKRSVVRKSHAEIAGELNVSREAVSRALKAMENQDDIHLGHGSIKVIHAKP